MLTAHQLAELYRTHCDDSILSVYLDTDQHDFAERDKWRRVFDKLVAAERRSADDPEAFDRAAKLVADALDPGWTGFVGGKGWVAFATPERRIHSASLPVSTPNLVRWERGLRIAPYARVARRPRAVVAVLADSRRARLMRWEDGRLRHERELRADTDLGDLSDVTVAKRARNASGVRGTTGADLAQRILGVERDRLLSRAAKEAADEVGPEGLLVVGGPERAVAELTRLLSGLDHGRLHRAQGLGFDATEAEIAVAVEAAAGALAEAVAERTVDGVVARARSGGNGVLGERDTERALREMRVETLVVSERLAARTPDRADHLEGAAFEQGADVVEAAGEAGHRLDAEGEGVGALLRYRA